MDNILVTDVEETAFGWNAQVVVGDEDDATAHFVTLTRDYAKQLSGQDEPDIRELLVKTFAYLLSKEPKEAILREFDLAVVKNYFKDFERSL